MIVGGVGICAIEIEIVRILNIRINRIKPIDTAATRVS